MIRIVLNGLGVVGCRAGKMIVNRSDMECVGAADADPKKLGKDLGEVLGLDRKLGIRVSPSLNAVIAQTKADIVVDATFSFMKDIRDYIFTAVKAGMNFVSSCEELAYPAAQYPEVAQEIDERAKRYSVTVLGTGVNPGFSPDFLPLTFLGVCEKVTSVLATRASNPHMFGAGVLDHFAIGKSLVDYEKSLADGSLTGHIGHPEQIHEIADALGWKLSEVKTTMKPLISKSSRQGHFFKVEPGQVCGLEQVATGVKDAMEVITLKYVLLFQPTREAEEEDGIESGDFISIQGIPNVEVKVKGIGQSDLVTATRVVNAIPYVVQARPGLLAMKDFPPFVPIG